MSSQHLSMSDLITDRLIKMQSHGTVPINIGSLPINSWCGTRRFYKEKPAVTATNSLIVDAILYVTSMHQMSGYQQSCM